MHIDQAAARLRTLLASLPAEDEKPINESCTRFRVIDPILVDVLGWPRSCVETELVAGEGLNEGRARLDYLLRGADGTPWFVVEAKRREHVLVDGRGDYGCFKLTGSVLRACYSGIIDRQMPPYLGRYMPRFGLVTNGEQWIAFLAAARPPSQELGDTNALVFRTLKQIEDEFESFYQAFAYAQVVRGYLHDVLVPHRGVIECRSPTPGIALDQDRPIDYRPDDAAFYEDLRHAMEGAFSPIQRDPTAYAACFVESTQSRDADSRLLRMQNELELVLLPATRYPNRVGEAVAERPGAGEASLPSADELRGQGYLVRLVGERSAGKSVFLRRFYEAQLDPAHRRHVALVWIDGEQLAPFEPLQTSRAALEGLKRAIFGEEGPEWSHLREIYSREWNAWTRLRGTDPRTEQPELRAQFADARLTDEANDPMAALERYADFAVRNRRLLPCFVVDNADTTESAKRAMAWALSAHLRTFALTTVATEDETLWRLRTSGDDDLSKHAPEQFWLPRPKVREVIERRCEYLRSVLLAGKGQAQPTVVRIGRYRQYNWRVNPDDVVRAVTAVLLDDQEVSNWIGEICNYDIREVLELSKQIVLSPLVRASSLLSAQVAHAPPSRLRVLRSIIAPKNLQFQPHESIQVLNVFGFWMEGQWAPLLPARLLELLRIREDDEHTRRESFPGFAPVVTLLSTFERTLGVPRRITLSALNRMRALRLIETYDPGCLELSGEGMRIKVTPRGRLHLEWCRREAIYVRMMAEVDPIADARVASGMKAAWQTFLTASRERHAQMADAERELVARYTTYVLDEAERVSPAVIGTDVDALREFEQDLRRRWSFRS